VPLTSWTEFRAWTDSVTPADMAMAILRLVALAAIWYLLVATALVAAARVVQVRGLTAFTQRVTPGLVRHLAAGGGGLGLALGTVVGALPPPHLHAAPAAAAAVTAATPPPTSPATTATMTREPDPAPPTATMTRIGDPLRTSVTMTRTAAIVPGPAPPGPEPPAADATTWVVEPGNSFWSIAEDVVAGPGQPPAPSERDVSRYWRRLVAANRGRLVDPGNPDLLLPGQTLTLPPRASP
jgi:nucleoid-associated protein YgaU